MDVLGLVREAEQQEITAATFCQDLQTMKEILDAGGDINRPAHDGRTALMIAAADDNIEGAKYLLFRGADMDIKSPVSGYFAIRHHVMVNAHSSATQEGKTALQIAEEFGSLTVLRLLRDAVLRIQRGMPPCVYKEPELVRNAKKTEVVSDPRFLGVSGVVKYEYVAS